VKVLDHSRDIFVGMADMKIARSPVKIKTNLGSCVGVCLYDAQQKTGGMLHLMMAQCGSDVNSANFKKAKYADTGIPELIHQIKIQFGVSRGGLIAKLFGGAKVLKSVSALIGEENEAFSREILKQHGIPIVAAHTGGDKGYNIEFDLSTGKVKCEVFNQASLIY
jgi:chemotaxis protein CheD